MPSPAARGIAALATTVLSPVLAGLVLTGLLGVPDLGLGPVAAAQGVTAPVRYTVVPEGSEVRYRVRERLVGLRFPSDAVGTSAAVEGGLTVDAQGRVAPGSRVVLDLRTLRSDEARRDNYVRRATLETDRYPMVVFVPTEIRGLPVPPPESGTAALEILGDLTVRDVTRRVTWAARATFAGPAVTVHARTAFRFGDFGLPVPRVSVVLSVEDDIHLEADLALRRGA